MRRLLCFTITAGLAMGSFTAVHAETFSFTVGGHHISISASQDCHRAGCVSVSIPGIVVSHHKRSDDVVAAQDAAPAKPARAAIAPAPVTPLPVTPLPVAPAPVAAPAPAPQIAPAAPPLETRTIIVPPASPSPPPAPTLAANDSTEVAAPAAVPMPVPAPPVLPATVRPAPDPAPVPEALVEMAETARDDTPIGDWQTEGKIGAVRIEACGKALCGYLINPSSHAKAETILINMKPKGDGKSSSGSEWRGSIFSRASGNTYNATMTLKAANLLRVEACALGRFFCSGNNWTRIIKGPAALVTSRDDDGEPRS